MDEKAQKNLEKLNEKIKNNGRTMSEEAQRDLAFIEAVKNWKPEDRILYVD